VRQSWYSFWFSFSRVIAQPSEDKKLLKTVETSLIPQEAGRFSKYEIPPLVVERAYLATTDCMAQDFFENNLLERYW
jgi:hypothetical protein